MSLTNAVYVAKYLALIDRLTKIHSSFSYLGILTCDVIYIFCSQSYLCPCSFTYSDIRCQGVKQK